MSTGGDWQLSAIAAALAIYACAALIAVVVPRRSLSFVYPVCAAAAALACAADLSAFFTQVTLQAHLPIGLPSVGLHFRLDTLSAFFGLIVNIGVFAASIYGLGLGRDDLSKRIEPFYPAFCAAMNTVLLADDAYGFLFFWELMSLSSWLLVVSRHADEESRKAGYVYLVMAAIGTVALLFAFGGMAGSAGGYAFELDPRQSAYAARIGFGACRGAGRNGLQSRYHAAPCMATARTSGCAKPCLGAYERCDDQGCRLRHYSCRF